MEKNDESNIDLISDLKSISCIMEDDAIYTQQKTEQFKIEIVPCDNLIKIIISHQRWSRSQPDAWSAFTKFTRTTSLFKEYHKKVKEICKRHNYRTHISRKDGLQIRIIEK